MRKPNSKASDYILTRAACVAIVASAAEVYPKECMGTIYVESKSKNLIIGAIPYQLAKRKDAEVTSNSATGFERFFSLGEYVKLGDYHSHTFQFFEQLLPLEPSETDLEQLKEGDIEVIVRAKRTNKKSYSWRVKEDGINISWGRFRFLISVFERLPGTDNEGIPLYKRLRLALA